MLLKLLRVSRTTKIWLYALPFVLLIIAPTVFGAISIPIGLVIGLIRKEWRLIVTFFACGVFGAIGQIFLVVNDPLRTQIDQLPGQFEQPATENLMSQARLSDLHGWNVQDGNNAYATKSVDGWWRVANSNPITGRANTEILTDYRYELVPGKTYTTSFYFRFEGLTISFEINSEREKATKIVKVAPGIYRASATFTVHKETSPRPLHIAYFGGFWHAIEIKFAQIEPASKANGFVEGPLRSPWWGVAWWLAIPLMGYSVFTFTSAILPMTSRLAIGTMLFTGLIVQFLVAFTQLGPDGRSAGLTLGSNFLGALSVMGAVLGAGVGGVWVWLIYTVCVSLTWVSGSRSALIALFFLGVILGTRASWLVRLIIISLLMLVVIFGTPRGLGRLVDSFNRQELQPRIVIWQVASQAIRKYPISGVGINRFDEFYLRSLPKNAIERVVPHAHNLFLGITAESGLLGLFALLGLLYLAFFQTIKAPRFLITSLFVVILITGGLDYIFFSTVMSYPFWVFVGLLSVKSHPNAF